MLPIQAMLGLPFICESCQELIQVSRYMIFCVTLV